MTQILIVEDSNTQQQLLTQLLQQHHFEVLTAQTGKAVFELLQQDSFIDLVLLDIVLPDISGFEVCRRLKKNAYTAHIPVVLCSSLNVQVNQYWGLRQGAAAYLAKPFRPHALLQIIQQLCHHVEGDEKTKVPSGCSISIQ